MVAVRKIDYGGYSVKFPRCDQFPNFGLNPFGAHGIGQFGDDDSLPAGRNVFDLRSSPNSDRSSSSFVRFSKRPVVKDDSTGRKIGPSNKSHKVIDGRFRATICQYVLDGSRYFRKVVRGHVGCHTHSNSRSAIY